MVRTCGHATWANSLAFEIANITNETPNPQGGEILRDSNGEATGVLTDTAASLGARSTWMLEEYSDREGHTGNGRYTDEEFYQLIKEARENGFQVATHAIGDAANKQLVDVYEKVLKEIGEVAEHFGYQVDWYPESMSISLGI